MSKNIKVKLSGSLTVQLNLSNNWNPTIPLANKKITIAECQSVPIEHEIRWPIGTIMTDAQGNFSLLYKPKKTATFNAMASESNGSVLVCSNFVTVIVKE